MTTSSKVSVVILNWNAMDVLRDCLESLNLSVQPLHEIIVVDNGSTDGSDKMVKEDFKAVTLIKNKSNFGAPKGRNVGIKWAIQDEIDYVYTLDNDLIIEAETIYRLVKLLDEDRTIGCAGSIIYHYDKPDIIFNAGNYVNYTQNLVRSRGLNQKDVGQFEERTEVDYVGTGAMLTRKSIYESVGLLDPVYIGYGYEDTDFGLRVNRAGHKVVCFTKSKVWHRPFTGVGRYSFKKKYLEARNSIIFMRRYGNLKNWVKFIFYVTLGLFYASIREGIRGNIMGVIGKAKGLFDGIKGREDYAIRLLDNKNMSKN
jgi:GT2 family glycosyltransferase